MCIVSCIYHEKSWNLISEICKCFLCCSWIYLMLLISLCPVIGLMVHIRLITISFIQLLQSIFVYRTSKGIHTTLWPKPLSKQLFLSKSNSNTAIKKYFKYKAIEGCNDPHYYWTTFSLYSSCLDFSWVSNWVYECCTCYTCLYYNIIMSI